MVTAETFVNFVEEAGEQLVRSVIPYQSPDGMSAEVPPAQRQKRRRVSSMLAIG